MEITAEKIMQQLSAGTQVAGVIAVFGEEGYYKDKIAAALAWVNWNGHFWNYHSSISKSAMAAGSLKSWKKY